MLEGAASSLDVSSTYRCTLLAFTEIPPGPIAYEGGPPPRRFLAFPSASPLRVSVCHFCLLSVWSDFLNTVILRASIAWARILFFLIACTYSPNSQLCSIRPPVHCRHEAHAVIIRLYPLISFRLSFSSHPADAAFERTVCRMTFVH